MLLYRLQQRESGELQNQNLEGITMNMDSEQMNKKETVSLTLSDEVTMCGHIMKRIATRNKRKKTNRRQTP